MSGGCKSKLKRLEFSYGDYMKIVLLVVLIIFLLGCVSKSQIRQISAGHIGCSHNNITILDYDSHSSFASTDTKKRGWYLVTTDTWITTCKGKRFICSEYSTGVNSSEVKCVQEIE